MTKRVARRLCFIVTSHVTAVTFLPGYLSELRHRGWEVTLVCSPGPGLDALAQAAGVTVHTVPMRRDPSPARDVVSLLRLTVLLTRLRPGVVVYATPKASFLGSIAASFAGVQVKIYELWGLRLETARGVSGTILRLIEKVTIRLSTSIVANSDSLAHKARSLGLLGKKSAVVLGAGSSHGVDTQHYSRIADFSAVDEQTQAFLNATEGLTVGFVGRLHPDKGIDTLVQALDRCFKEGTVVRALIVGGDEGVSGSSLRTQLTTPVPVRFVGEVADPRPYLARMDLLVLLSLREGFPNVVLEAAAMEVPALVSDSTGTVDSVIDRVTGYVVPTGDATAVAQRISELSQDRDARERLGGKARERVVQQFAHSTVLQAHVEHYGKVAKLDRD